MKSAEMEFSGPETSTQAEKTRFSGPDREKYRGIGDPKSEGLRRTRYGVSQVDFPVSFTDNMFLGVESSVLMLGDMQNSVGTGRTGSREADVGSGAGRSAELVCGSASGRYRLGSVGTVVNVMRPMSLFALVLSVETDMESL